MHTDMWREELNRQTHRRKDGPLSLAFLSHFFPIYTSAEERRITAAAPAVKVTYRPARGPVQCWEEAVTLSKTICAAEVEEEYGSLLEQRVEIKLCKKKKKKQLQVKVLKWKHHHKNVVSKVSFNNLHVLITFLFVICERIVMQREKWDLIRLSRLPLQACGLFVSCLMLLDCGFFFFFFNDSDFEVLKWRPLPQTNDQHPA